MDAGQEVDFSNTEIAFHHRSTVDLLKSQVIFKAFASSLLVKTGAKIAETALAWHLPVGPFIKMTVFNQFCGGESIDQCKETVEELGRFGVGSILDYSVEARSKEEDFDQTRDEILRIIHEAARNPHIPFAVFKVTGLARFALLEKVDQAQKLSEAEAEEYARVRARISALCEAAYANGVRIMVDAEESWIQGAIDELAVSMMRRYNKDQAIVYNTIQLYRTDRLAYLQALDEHGRESGFHVGVKLVRGAYMEKERWRAKEFGYESPIQPNKSAADRDYDAALEYCVCNMDRISICAGTHNERSTCYLTDLLDRHGVARNDDRVVFSQLLGMSDHLTFNLSAHGYNVCKYVPYGPVRVVVPYLVRRAEENTSIKGQMGRELQLIENELKRRRRR